MSVERAFVFVKTLAQVPQFGHDGNIRSWAVVPILENSGSTPTKHLIYHISIDTPDEDLPEDFSFPDKWAEGVPMEARPAFVGPKAQLWGAGIELHIVDLDHFKMVERGDLYGAGSTTMSIFPNTPRHRTEFCVEVTAVRLSPDRLPVTA